MSGQHWIDAFFRKRLERHTFPVEKGEFDEVRALLHKRNATTTLVRGGRFSKWWLSALIPIAGLLWWAVQGEAADTDARATQVADHRISSGENTSSEQAKLTASFGTEVMPDPSRGTIGTVATMSEEPAVDILDRTTPPHEARAEPRSAGNAQSHQAAFAHRSRAQVVAEIPEQVSTNDQLDEQGRSSRDIGRGSAAGQGSTSKQQDVQTGTLVNQNRASRSEHGDMIAQGNVLDNVSSSGSVDASVAGIDDGSAAPLNTRMRSQSENGQVIAQVDVLDNASSSGSVDASLAGIDDGSATTLSTRMKSPSEKGDMIAQVDVLDNASSSGSMDALSEQRAADAIPFMEPRWSSPPAADARQPVQRVIQPWKRYSAGALHVFGAPLAVRARSSNGDRSGAEAGSLVGFEYRVHARHFTWATGVYYGSYALKADQGATDVKLEFLEVPLLASVALRKGRFGLLMQGGMSVDLLFNSSGRYPVEGIGTSAGFSDGAFRAVNYSWLLRPQATYQVDEHLSITAGPLWKAQLGEVAKEGALNGAHMSSSGVSVGITWRLERSTF